MKKTTCSVFVAASMMMVPWLQAADTIADKEAARVCLSTENFGSDGVDRFQAKMSALRASKTGKEAAQCVPAKVYLNTGSNGSDGVDRHQEKMAKLRNDQSQAKPAPAKVYLNVGPNGTDGVDRFQERMNRH